MKLDTINVIQTDGGHIVSLKSFSVNKEGQKEAIAHFEHVLETELGESANIFEDEIKRAIEQEHFYCEEFDPDFELSIVNSDNE